MRNGQNNKRLRNRNNGGNNNNNNNNRRGQNPMTRVFESNGPDIKIRGTASHVAEKYVQLARDARSSGDPVAAENYYQHAEHYFRLIAAAQEQFRQNQPQQQQQPRIDTDFSDSDDDGDSDGYSNFGAEPGLVPQPQPSFQPREQREPRDAQPQFQPREQPQPREHRPQPRDFQPRERPQPQPQPSVEGVDSLPSFITGSQPQLTPNAFDNNGGGERFPRRRRRPQPNRGEGAAQAAAPAVASDASPGNE